MKSRFLLVAGLVLTASILCAQAPAPPPVNRDFDFWIGEWDVTTPDGRPAGSNRIEPVAGGRGLLEHWEGAAQPDGRPGVPGKSLNAYDPATQKWRQFWVGGGGAVLELAGGLADGNMVLVGERPLRDGRRQTNRITWTPKADGTVRQHWEQSLDGGSTWTTAFDGLYRRRSETAPNWKSDSPRRD
jgi:hypothetical protein